MQVKTRRLSQHPIVDTHRSHRAYSLVLAGALAISAAVHPSAFATGFIAEGQKLPAFTLPALDGAPFDSKTLAGKPGIIVFVRPGQGSTASLLGDLKQVRKLVSGEWSAVAICSGRVSADDARKLVTEAEFSGTVLFDGDRKVYANYGVVAVPSLAVFDSESRVTYSRPGFGNDIVKAVGGHIGKLLGAGGLSSPAAPDIHHHFHAKIALARRLAGRGDLAKAEALLRTVVQEAGPPEAHLELVSVLIALDRAKEALAVAQKAREAYPRKPEPGIATAKALAALGRDSEAAILLADLAIRYPSSWESHLELARVHAKQGKKDDAIREYERAAKILQKALRASEESSPQTTAGRAATTPNTAPKKP